jgi:steroid 5-alpha reductase family enzyme
LIPTASLEDSRKKFKKDPKNKGKIDYTGFFNFNSQPSAFAFGFAAGLLLKLKNHQLSQSFLCFAAQPVS